MLGGGGDDGVVVVREAAAAIFVELDEVEGGKGGRGGHAEEWKCFVHPSPRPALVWPFAVEIIAKRRHAHKFLIRKFLHNC